MTLKEQFAVDLKSIFFDPGELGEPREINGQEVMVVEDGEKLREYQLQGICQGQKLLYIQAADLDPIPQAGDNLRYGKTMWRVEECKEDAGLLELVLERWSR